VVNFSSSLPAATEVYKPSKTCSFLKDVGPYTGSFTAYDSTAVRKLFIHQRDSVYIVQRPVRKHHIIYSF